MAKKIILNVLGIIMPFMLIIMLVQLFLHQTIFGLIVDSVPFLYKLNPSQYRFSLRSLYDSLKSLGFTLTGANELLARVVNTLIDTYLTHIVDPLYEYFDTMGDFIDNFSFPSFTGDNIQSWLSSIFVLLNDLLSFAVCVFTLVCSVLFFPIYCIGAGIVAAFSAIGFFIFAFITWVTHLLLGQFNTPIYHPNAYEVPNLVPNMQDIIDYWKQVFHIYLVIA